MKLFKFIPYMFYLIWLFLTGYEYEKKMSLQSDYVQLKYFILRGSVNVYLFDALLHYKL